MGKNPNKTKLTSNFIYQHPEIISTGFVASRYDMKISLVNHISLLCRHSSVAKLCLGPTMARKRAETICVKSCFE